MDLEVEGFDWDDANLGKCRKHGVSPAEVESALRRSVAVFPDPVHSDAETGFKAIGRTAAGRSILIVFTLRGGPTARLIRPISARFMHAKEVKHYEEEAARAQHRQGS